MPPIPDDFELRLAGHRGGLSSSPPTRRAAVAALLRPAHDGPEVLLMRRVEHPDDPWSGHVSLPGGSREPADPDLLATALRETHEEVGLALSPDALLCRLDPIGAVGRRLGFELDITPFVFRVDAGVRPVAGPEAQEVFWLPLRAAARGDLDHEVRWQEGAAVARHPAWRLGERVVWGLTYRMLIEVLRVGGVGT